MGWNDSASGPMGWADDSWQHIRVCLPFPTRAPGPPVIWQILAVIDALTRHRSCFNLNKTLSMIFGVMPSKQLSEPFIHPIVLQRLRQWGSAIRQQRIRQDILSQELCRRLSVSASTLRRMEHGDPAVNTGAYLAALNALGLLSQVAPELAPDLYAGNRAARARRNVREDDEEYF